jgi:hypothetical protein
MYEYWLSDGSNNDTRNKTDHWAPDMNNWWREAQQHKEKMFGTWRGDAYLITQPCNYVSNIAYYRTVLRICDY